MTDGTDGDSVRTVATADAAATAGLATRGASVLAGTGGTTFAAAATGTIGAQNQRTLTAAVYDRAVKMLAPGLTGLVVGDTVDATWLPDGRFWYVRTTLTGDENVVIDPVTKTREVVQTPPPGGQPPQQRGGRGGRGEGRGGGGSGVALSRTCGPNVTGMTGPPPPS